MTIFCEGKYDHIYLSKIIAFYNLDKIVDIIPCEGKRQVLSKFKKKILRNY